MGLFVRKSGSVLGLDIDSTAVRLIELSRSASGYRVEACALESLPSGAVSASNISDTNAVGEVIRRAVKRAGCQARRAALAVPGSAAITKIIAMDASLTDDELEAAITVEADRHLPFAADQVAFDFEPMHLSTSDPSRVDVSLAACRRQHVQSLEAAAMHGGVPAAIVDVETYCLHRAAELLRAKQEDAPIALAHIRSATTALLVIEREAVVFTREEPFAEARLRSASAEAAKDELLRLVYRLLRLYLSGRTEAQPQRLLFAGVGASAPGLADLASQRLQLTAQVANPFAGMALAKRVDADALECNAPTLMTACGLALRSFDVGRGVH